MVLTTGGMQAPSRGTWKKKSLSKYSSVVFNFGTIYLHFTTSRRQLYWVFSCKAFKRVIVPHCIIEVLAIVPLFVQLLRCISVHFMFCQFKDCIARQCCYWMQHFLEWIFSEAEHVHWQNDFIYCWAAVYICFFSLEGVKRLLYIISLVVT